MSVKITATDRLGAEYSLDAEVGATVMETLRDAGLPVEAVCGGCCSCATCHVYVDPGWTTTVGERNEEEDELLRTTEYMDEQYSRLGCQIAISQSLDGLRVTLAPEE